ncbi:MAG: hypothetical protein AAFV72_08200 [Cyanobacteria bacterium J06635_1]
MKYAGKTKSALITLLTLTGVFTLGTSHAQVSEEPGNTDFCFMRTAEGEYVPLNHLCQPPSPAERSTTSEASAPSRRPTSTSTPAQSSTPAQVVDSEAPGTDEAAVEGDPAEQASEDPLEADPEAIPTETEETDAPGPRRADGSSEAEPIRGDSSETSVTDDTSPDGEDTSSENDEIIRIINE